MIIRVVDVETCGLPPNDAQIVEVATVDLVSAGDPALWGRGKMWSSLVNPGRPIPPEASAVHHITDDMVKDAPRFADLPPFLAAADLVCAHAAKFERECLRLNDASADVDIMRWICTYKCGVLLFPDAPNHKNQTLRYFLGLKLADASLALPHRALGDAYVTAAILRTFLRAATIEQMVEASSGPVMLPKLTFGEHAMKPIAEVPTSYFEWIVHKSKGPWDEDVLHTAKCQLAERRQGAA